MEKKQNSATTTCPLGPCEKLFNAFHINSSIPITHRLTFRQQEPSAVNNGRPPFPANTSPATTNGISNAQVKKPSHLQEKHEQFHFIPQTNSHKESMPMPLAETIAPVQPETGPKSSSLAQVEKKKVTLDPNSDKEDNTSQATKSKMNINEKFDDFISRAKSKMRGSLGRTHTSSKG